MADAKKSAKGKPAKRGRAAAPAVKTAMPGKSAPASSVAGFELNDLRHLIDLVQDTGIGEIELNSNGRSVRISANSLGGGTWVEAPAAAGRPAPAPAAAPAVASAPVAEPVSTQKAVTSPMVGTFYRSPAPDADPFVEVGDIIEIGQTVCIIEAMKLMNEIEAEVKGRVVQILVDNSQAVEFGQKLFLVEPV